MLKSFNHKVKTLILHESRICLLGGFARETDHIWHNIEFGIISKNG